MTELLSRFQQEQKNNPLYSTFVHFSNATRGLSLTGAQIRQGFFELVDKKDYDEVDIDRLVTYLQERS